MNFLEELLQTAVKENASDLHLIAGESPLLRIGGHLETMRVNPINPEQIEKALISLLNPMQKEQLEKEMELSFSAYFPGVGRFRVSLYHSKGNLEGTIRIIGDRLKSLEELRLPDFVEEAAHYPNGMVLVTGPTGAGKTTTLNVMIDIINRFRRAKVLTVEDPIEYYHSNKKSIIVQKEVLADTRSFESALYHALREDPDVIVIGEMRNLETIRTALIAAETGHLVLATLHTADATQTIDRIIDVFPPHHQQQVRVQLAYTLKGVISQRLLPMTDTKNRILAHEILRANSAVRNCIRENKSQNIPNVIQTHFGEGMILMDYVIKDLYLEGLISYDTAIQNLANKKLLKSGY